MKQIWILTLLLIAGILCSQDLQTIVLEEDELELEWQRYLVMESMDESQLTQEERILYLESVREGLLMRKALVYLAESAELTPSDLEVEQEYEAIRSRVRDAQQWQQLLEAQFYDEESFRDYIYQSLSMERWLRHQVVSQVSISDDEVEEYYLTHPEEFMENGEVLSLEMVHTSLTEFLFDQKAQKAVSDYMDLVRNAMNQP